MSLHMFSIAMLLIRISIANLAVGVEANVAAEVEEEIFVRRHTNTAKLVKPVLWDSFVRHENPAKAKEKFENGLTDGLMLEVLIAVFGFACTIGIQAFLRMKKKQHKHPNPRTRTSKHAAERSATSMSGGATSGGRNRVPHPEGCDDAVPEEEPLVVASVQPGGTSDASNGVEKRQNQSSAGTDADVLKKIAKAIGSGKVSDLGRFLDISLTSIERNSLPLAGPKATSEALMVLLRACAASRCYEEAIAAYDHLGSRIGLGTRQLWSLLLYISTEAHADSRSVEFYAKLCAEVGDSGPSGRDLVNIIRLHARSNDLFGLRAVLDGLKDVTSCGQYDRLMRNRALAACYKAGAPELADCIANSPIFSAPLDIVGFNTLITCYSRAGLYEKCFATFDGMDANGVVPTQATFGSLMEACVGSEDWDRAKTFCKKLPSYGLAMNAQHCTILIKGLVKQKRLIEAEQLLKDMSLRADIRLDVVAFYTLLRAYSDVGDSDGAERVYSGMIHHGVQEDEFVCNAMIHSCTVTKTDAAYINSILDRSMAAGVHPSATTLSLMLKAFALGKDFDAGLKLLKSSADRFGISKTEPRLFVQFAQAAIKSGEKAKALEVHEAMIKALSANGQDSYKAASRWLLRQCERV